VPDIASLVQILLAILVIAGPSLLLAVLVRGDETWSLTNLWTAPDHDAWPRGVQEEEPFRWGSDRGVPADAAADGPAAPSVPATRRTTPHRLHPAGSAAAHDPIGEVA
jgi:hypothetical protein